MKFRSDIEKNRIIHRTYFDELERFYQIAIPPGMRVLELGCHTGRLLASVSPRFGLGIDIDAKCIEAAKEIHQNKPELQFLTADVEKMVWDEFEPFDYIILSDLTPLLKDIQTDLQRLHAVVRPETRIILNYHNNLWQPFLEFASMLGIRKKHKKINWLSTQDINNLLYLADYEEVIRCTRVLLPLKIPVLTAFANRFLAKLPIINHFCLTCFTIARSKKQAASEQPLSVSVVIPTRNERGNIQDIFTRTPQMGKWTELVFVDGNSDDGTVEAINQGIHDFSKNWHRAILLHQVGKGKGQAVRQAFDSCEGDVLMILDSDITMPPEDLPKYLEAITTNKGEFINGSRLVYPMEQKAMRFLNMIANKIFAILFTWLLQQPVKDTLCGTKVIKRKDYIKIAANRSYFGDFDPFGDFDLLFGASKLNLKIIDLPIRYRERTYGDIKISRWSHGLLLLRMCLIAFKKLKLS